MRANPSPPRVTSMLVPQQPRLRSLLPGLSSSHDPCDDLQCFHLSEVFHCCFSCALVPPPLCGRRSLLQATLLPGARQQLWSHKKNPGWEGRPTQDQHLGHGRMTVCTGTQLRVCWAPMCRVGDPAQGSALTGLPCSDLLRKPRTLGPSATCFCSLLEDSGRNGRDFPDLGSFACGR